MISRIQNCVMISLESVEDAPAELPDNFPHIADHGMIYIAENSKTYHSSAGRHQSGVRSHPALKSSESQSEAEDGGFGYLVVFNIQDTAVRENLTGVVKRWDPKEDPVLYAQLRKQQTEDKMLRLPTPFVDFFKRPSDKGTPDDISRLELYRAFRAYERNLLKLPLSKEKGVSCGNFISYAMKVSIIQRLFPDGLPKEITEKIHEIENKKTKDNRKLSAVAPEDFANFEKIVLKHLQNLNKSDPIDPLLQELRRPVKGVSVNQFCRDAFHNSNIYNFGGYCFVREINGKEELWVMPHALFVKFIEKYPESSFKITDAQLNSLGITELANEEKRLPQDLTETKMADQVNANVTPETFVDNYCTNKIKELQSSHSFYSPSPIGITEYQFIKDLSLENKIIIAAAMKKNIDYLEKYHFKIQKVFSPAMSQLFSLEKNGMLDFDYKNDNAKELVATIKKTASQFTDKGIAEIFTNESHPNYDMFMNEKTAQSHAAEFKKNMEILNIHYQQEIAQMHQNPS